MKKKRVKQEASKASGRYDHMAAESDFYGVSSNSEQPLYEEKRRVDDGKVRKTGRHQAVSGRREEGIDPREKLAFVAILRSIIVILFLMIGFFVLYKGVSIYEETKFRETIPTAKVAPVLRAVVELQDFDIENQDARELFAERIEVWKEADRLVRSTDALVNRGNLDQAIKRCQDALNLAAWHQGALELLGSLYYEKGMYVESVNAYIRLLSVDPSRKDLQEKLIQTLAGYGDARAVVYMSRWYLDQNHYNENIQQYLAGGLFDLEEFEDAAAAYERVLNDDAQDKVALEKLSEAYIVLERYEDALDILERLHAQNYRDPSYYQHIAICNAQLGNSLETVQTLGKAAHLFGQPTVMEWIQDPRLDPVREDRQFQSFADRVGGEEFRMYLEKVAKAVDGDESQKEIKPQLELPNQGGLSQELLPAGQ